MRTDKAVARLDRAVKSAIVESGLTGGKRLVVAVSGGPDSLALLLALSRLRDELDLELHGAHLDHGLRAEAAEADARFVAATFRELAIDLTSERADVQSYRRSRRLSLEEAAREVRYAFLGRVAAEVDADAVALGHTSDDQAATVLMHVIRGTGLTGLRGMEPSVRRTLGDREVLLMRPLLGVSRTDTMEYCRALDAEPREDESNQSLEMARNRIRLELLPLLEEHNPAVRDALVRLSRSAAHDVAYLDSQVESVWHETAREEPGHVALGTDAFRALSPALQAHLLRRAVALVKGDLNEIEQVHVEGMVRLMGGPAGRSLDLPGRLRFAVGYGEATIAPADSDLCPLPPLEGESRLQVPGETLIHGWRITANIVQRSPKEAVDTRPRQHGDSRPDTPDGLGVYLSNKLLGGELHARPRKRGDRFQPLGMAGPKKLQDFMVDSKIPRPWRDRVPLVCSPDGIAWVVGWRVADWAKVKEGETQQLQLRFLPRGR